MKDTDRSLLLLISPCAAMIIILMTAGCVTGPGKIAIAPEVRSKLKDEPEITAFRYAKGVGLSLANESKKLIPTVYDEYKIIEIREDPVVPLMESFISAVQAELKLNNIHTLPEPRHHHPNYRFRLDRNPERAYDLIQIQRTFRAGLVFDFDRDGFVFDVDFFRSAFRVHLWAKARLIRVDDQKILWQGVCDISDHSITLDDFQFDLPEADNPGALANPGTGKASALAQERLDKAAKACANELMTQFMGK